MSPTREFERPPGADYPLFCRRGRRSAERFCCPQCIAVLPPWLCLASLGDPAMQGVSNS